MEMAELLLDRGAPTDLQPGKRQRPARFHTFAGKVTNQSPLLAAIVGGHPSVVSLLLARGARTDVADRHGYVITRYTTLVSSARPLTLYPYCSPPGQMYMCMIRAD
ncbi:hypothetical protein BJX66DRAFT_318484 [Aspergillus keveii]|uniref:Ankyrin repeat protein n=1 Tax=Aspergillus keveii TaxID=714993 RepID=A0ABR4FJM7_9EURO